MRGLTVGASPLWPCLLLALLPLIQSAPRPTQNWFQTLPPADYFEPDVDTTSTVPLPRIPASPYGTPALVCPPADGVPYSVSGYPGTPYIITPFSNKFQEPPVLDPVGVVCRTGDTNPKHCLKAFDLEITGFQSRVFDQAIPACASRPATWLMGYNGISPGPTIKATV